MSNATFLVAEHIQLQFSEFEDRLILVAHLKSHSVTLLLTRRLALPLLEQVYKLAPGDDGLTLPLEQVPVQPQASSYPDISSDETALQVNNAPLFLATKVDIQQKTEGFVLAFTGLSLPDAMVKAQPHQPVFAIPFNVQKLGRFSTLLQQKIHQSGWQTTSLNLEASQQTIARVLH